MSNGTKSGGDEPFNGTSKTRFGSSVESQAQIRDSSPQNVHALGELLNIYRLVPLAPPEDLNWDNSLGSGDLVVAARTAGDARIVASDAEPDFMKTDSAPAEDVTTSNASAFRNEKLYTVVEIAHGRNDVERGVLRFY